LRDLGQLFAFEIGIFGLERLGQHFAITVQFNQERFVNVFVTSLEQLTTKSSAFWFRQRFGEFGE